MSAEEVVRQTYLSELREDMATEVLLIRDPEGGLRFGFRCWPDHREQPILDAALDGLEKAHRTLGLELYAVMIDADAEPGDLDSWTEAWRASNRERVFAGPFQEVVRRIYENHPPRSRG